ncbi:carboxymuconolactone decarboxylase family protein [Myxococcota bacterium]
MTDLEDCCAEGSGNPEEAVAMFQDFMGTSLKPGALDVVTKRLMAISLGLAVHCTHCVRIHLKQAKDMGISMEEIDEAVSLATAFSGCRALMLFREIKLEVFGK